MSIVAKKMQEEMARRVCRRHRGNPPGGSVHHVKPLHQELQHDGYVPEPEEEQAHQFQIIIEGNDPEALK